MPTDGLSESHAELQLWPLNCDHTYLAEVCSLLYYSAFIGLPEVKHLAAHQNIFICKSFSHAVVLTVNFKTYMSF